MLPVPAQTDPVTHRLWQLLSLGSDTFLSTVPPRGLQHSVKSRALKESPVFPARRGGRREGGRREGGRREVAREREREKEGTKEGERRNEGGRRKGGKREGEREKERGKKW